MDSDSNFLNAGKMEPSGNILEERGQPEMIGRNLLKIDLRSGRAGCILVTKGHLNEQSSSLVENTRSLLEILTIALK